MPTFSTLGWASLALLTLFLAAPQSGVAQLAGPRTQTGCFRVQGMQSEAVRLTAEGRLAMQRFPGPPNFTSIAAGDAEERTLILELPRQACIDDGGDFADPAERFETVQLGPANETLAAFLRSAVGRSIRVTGEGFAAQTGHHHARLVIIVDEAVVR